MGQMTRGGRALTNDLHDQVLMLRQALSKAREYNMKAREMVKWHPDLSLELLEKQLNRSFKEMDDAIEFIEQLRSERLESMLRRRIAPDDLGERVATLEKQLVDLKRQWANEPPRILRNERAERG